MMEVAALEILLLDTTEKEGEDNKLLHVRELWTGAQSRSSELRGVFAAAMGTMASVAGEPLVAAHFASIDETEGNEQSTAVGFVDLNEVLFVMLFVECTLPKRIIDYYTQSSCELLVGLLGYPDQKLSAWKAEPGVSIEAKVTRMCQGLFAIIRRDLRFETHLQFAFDGCVPAVTYPIETMARLSAFQVVEPQSDSYEMVGSAVFYRNMLVYAKTTPPILQLLGQWLLYDEFDQEAEAGPEASLMLFKWFDPNYALYGRFPPIHSLVRIRFGQLHAFYLLRHTDANAFERFKKDPNVLLSTEDLAELLNFADVKLCRHYESALSARRSDVVPTKPIWYTCVVDKLRHTLHGFKPQEIFASKGDSQQWKSLLKMVIVQCSGSFRTRHHVLLPNADSLTNDSAPPLQRRWVSRVNVNFASHNKLLLRPTRPEDEAGADISSEESQIFPPVSHQLEREAAELDDQYPWGELQQEAARMRLPDGRFVWVIANYYEAFELFGVCDTAIPVERLEQEMESLLRLE